MPHGVVKSLQLLDLPVQKQCVMVCSQFHQLIGKVDDHTSHLGQETAKLNTMFDVEITIAVLKLMADKHIGLVTGDVQISPKVYYVNCKL